MNRNRRKEYSNSFAFLELIIVLAIILVIFSLMSKMFLKKSTINKETEKALSGQGIDTSNYNTIVDSTKNKLGDIQSKHSADLESISGN